MDVAIHRVGFPCLRIKLRPNLRTLLGRNTAEVLSNVEHVVTLQVKECHRFVCGICAAAVVSNLIAYFFHCLISCQDQIYKKVKVNNLVIQVRHPFGLLIQKFGHWRPQINN